jgi:hypothetical protein
MGLHNVVKVIFDGEERDFVSLAKEYGLRRDTIYERWRRIGKPEELPPEALRPADHKKAVRKTKVILVYVTWADGKTEPLALNDMPDRFHERVGLVLGPHAFRDRWKRAGSPLACSYEVFTSPLNGMKSVGKGYSHEGVAFYQEVPLDMSDLSHLSDTPTSEQFERLLRIPLPTNYEERL